MTQLIITVAGGIIVAIVVGWFDLGGSTRVMVQGVKVKKTGKWMIIFSIAMILTGLILCSKNTLPQGGYDLHASSTLYGLTLILYGGIIFVVGKIVAWFQRL